MMNFTNYWKANLDQHVSQKLQGAVVSWSPCTTALPLATSVHSKTQTQNTLMFLAQGGGSHCFEYAQSILHIQAYLPEKTIRDLPALREGSVSNSSIL